MKNLYQADTAETVTLSGPPRPVPLSVRLRVLFGGFSNQFGWLFFGFGMIFVWVLAPHDAVKVWYQFRGPIVTAQGTVTGTESANLEVNDVPVYAYYYEFADDDGEKHTGISYGSEGRYEFDEAVTVEYREDKPDISRIAGMQTSKSGLFSLIVLVFPVAGLVFVFLGVRKGFKGVRLLRNGKQAIGTLISVKPTRTRVNEQTVYKFTFKFTAEDGKRYKAVARTHETDKFEGEFHDNDEDEINYEESDEVTEPLLYDPQDPSRAMMLDDLPGQPRIDENGAICVDSPAKTLLTLIIPAVAIIGHGSYLLLRG